jgi:hypothetical protein
MHIQNNRISVNAINSMNPYSAAADKAAAAQKSAEVRRKLLKSAGGLDGNASPEEVMLLGKWMGSSQRPEQGDVEYRATTAGKDSDFG